MLIHNLIKLNCNHNTLAKCFSNLINIRYLSSIKIAVIGSGPAGFYTTQALLKVSAFFILKLKIQIIIYYLFRIQM